MNIFDIISDVKNMQIERSFRPLKYQEPKETAEEWYRSRVALAKKIGPYSGPFPETICAERAALLLEVNPDNRQFKKGSGEEMRNSLVTGQWELNGETVIVSIEGLLNDGQNRLKAVVDTGVPITTFVSWGVKRDTRRTLDIGSTRLPADFITMEGGTDGSLAAAVAKWLLMYERGVYIDNRCNTNMPTKPEVTAFWIQNKDEIYASLSFVRRVSAKDLGGLTALAVSYIIAERYNTSVAQIFFDLICDGAGQQWATGTPAFVVRNRLLQISNKRPSEKIELILRGFRMFVEGKQRVGSIPILGRFPEVE